MLKQKVLIEIKGGLVSAVHTDGAIEVYVANHDTEGMNKEELIDLSEEVKWTVDVESCDEVNERLEQISQQFKEQSDNL